MILRTAFFHPGCSAFIRSRAYPDSHPAPMYSVEHSSKMLDRKLFFTAGSSRKKFHPVRLAHPLARSHVILIDDARLFNGADDHPTLETLDAVLAPAGFGGCRVRVDIIRIHR
jgi:hypothetical protein